jgi:ABC-type cobalamin/Fe3+-siderophores transport system ATPase subunit
MERIIECGNIVFSYNGTEVLKGIDFSVSPGEMVGILGANGAGKSTLLKILSGLLQPKSGETLYRNKELSKLSRKELSKRLAYIPQDPVFSFPFTVTETVLMGRAPYIGRFEFERERDLEIAERAMKTVGITPLKDRLISQISAGERQLASLARALVQEPEIMILDEPATFLDVRHRTEIMKILIKLKEERGISIVAATHDIFSALYYFEEIKILKDGIIFAEGKTETVVTEDILSSAYGIKVTVKKDNGRVFVFPSD